MRLKVALVLAFFALAINLCAQIDTAYFQKEELLLIELNKKIAQSTGSDKKANEQLFLNDFKKVLEHEGSEEFLFDSLNFVGRVPTKDNKVIVFSWNIPQQGGFNNYYCIIQYYSKKDKSYKVQNLKEKIGFLSQSPQMLATVDFWPGALYYEIIPNKYKGDMYYTLLGFDFNNLISNRKVIEMIKIDDDNIEFTTDKFQYDNQLQTRIIFEYAERAQMVLKYNPDKEMIFYDHLSPYKPSLEGKYQFYGPDFSYDGFIFVDGIWQHQNDINPGL